MIEQIRRCQKCGLCFNQKPLLDTEKECQVFWVGLSAKKMESDEEVPLSPETNTGMLIQKIEELCGEVITYKTNLVKCLPLTEEQKFEKWDEFEYHYKKYEGTYYVPIHHPSYIYVYKRKRMDEYIEGVERIINQLL